MSGGALNHVQLDMECGIVPCEGNLRTLQEWLRQHLLHPSPAIDQMSEEERAEVKAHGVRALAAIAELFAIIEQLQRKAADLAEIAREVDYNDGSRGVWDALLEWGRECRAHDHASTTVDKEP